MWQVFPGKKHGLMYPSPLSPTDVIEKHQAGTDIENCRTVTMPAHEWIGAGRTSAVGTLEAFNTDGLRSLFAYDEACPEYEGKDTFVIPGSINIIRALKETGISLTVRLSVINGTSVSPIDFTSRILFNAWKPDDAMRNSPL
jgi:saccharopine dehydrogenase-like NADP-dependent oxidoreductase